MQEGVFYTSNPDVPIIIPKVVLIAHLGNNI